MDPKTDEQVVAQESNDAFESGFGGVRGESTPSPQPAEPAPDTAPTPEPAKEGEAAPEVKGGGLPDPWAGVPDVVKATLDSMNGKLGEVDKVSGRLRNVEGHLGGIAAQLKTALASAKTVEKEGAKAPTQEQIEKAAASSDRWNRIKEDFPEWAEAMDERLAAMRAESKPAVDVEGLRKDLGEKLTAEAEARFKQELRKRDETLVEFRHPGWKSEVKSPDFDAWFKTQPKEVQDLAGSDDAMDAIQLIDKFKLAKKAGKQEKDQRLRSAATPPGTAAAPIPKNEDDAFENSFNATRGV